MSKVLLCEYCDNRNGINCEKCSNNSQKAGRELCIERMKEDKGIKSSAKLRNIVRASEIVLFKDLCRILNVPPSLANKVTTNEIGEVALNDHLPANELERNLRTFLTDDEVDVFVEKEVFKNIDYCYECAGMVYGSSIHASGTLLSESDIELPIDAQTGDCHCNGHYAEELGYIKYDLLSLNSLNPILDIEGINIDWNKSSNDRNILDRMQDEDLTFWFQFGSPIVDRMVQGIPKEDLDVISLSEITSINRPGPLNINLNETWVDRKNGNIPMKNEIDAFIKKVAESGKLKLDIKIPEVNGSYNEELVNLLIENIDNPDFEEENEDYSKLRDLIVEKVISLVLEKKYGIPDKLLIFQEDIMALCSYGAGFKLSESDDVRRAMGKKKGDLMASFEGQFIDGWNNIVGIFSRDVWDKMVDYAKYCFNKSHAVAYTLVTLKTGDLQINNFNDYMKWNYENLKQDMKKKAVDILKEKGKNIKFPNYTSPFEGIKIGDIELNAIELEEGSEIQKEYGTLSELFLADIPPSYKLRFIQRGLYDYWTKDILGLVKLNKGLGKKALTGAQFPTTNSFPEFLDMLQMKKYIRYRNTPEAYYVTTKIKIKTEDLKDEDFIRIGKGLENMTRESKNYQAKCLTKEFGTYKNNYLSSFPEEYEARFLNFIGKYKDVFDRVYERNPGSKIRGRDLQRIMTSPKKLHEAMAINNERFGEYLAYVRDIKVQKTGSAKVSLVFYDGYNRVFYSRDKNIITNVSKNDVCLFSITPAQYIGRDGYLKGVLNIGLVEN